MCAKNYSNKEFTILFGRWSSFICFRSRLHQVMQSEFIAPKKVCLQQGRATIYLNGPKRAIVIILRAGQFSTRQKQLFLLILVVFKKISQSIYT